MKTKRISTNFVINLGGAIVPVFVSLVTVPLYIHNIGTDRYGVLAIVWVLLGYFSFLDLGLSRAAANALAKLHHNHRERSDILVTALSINLFFGTLGGIALNFFGDYLLDTASGMSPLLRSEIHAALPWIAGLVPIALAFGVANGALESRERFLLANVLSTVGSAVGQVLPVVAAILISPSLSVVIPAAVLARLASFLLIMGFVIASETSLRSARVTRTRILQLLGYGGWVSVSGLISPMLTSLDQLVVARLLGASAVAHYSVSMNLVSRSQLLASALSRTLFPRLSRHEAAGAKDLAEQAVVTLGFAYGAGCAVGIVLFEPFLALWIGPDFAREAGIVGQVLLVGAWFNGLAFIPYALVQAQGRPDLTAKLHVAEAVPYVVLLWLLATHYGLFGAALAWTLRVVADALLLAWVSRLGSTVLLRLVVPLAGLAAAVLATRLGSTISPALAVAAAAVGIAVVAAGAVYDPVGRRFAFAVLRRLRPPQR